MKRKISFIILFLLFEIFSVSQVVNADALSLDVQILFPENQVEKNIGWFDVKLDPGEKQILQLKVFNHSDKKVRVEVRPTDAITSESGEINYLPYHGKLDDTLKYRFPKLTSSRQKISLPAKSSKIVSFTVKVPKSTKNQMIMGGFNIKQLDYKPKSQKISGNKEKQVEIKSYYNYSVAAVILVGKIPEPNVRLISVAPGFQSGYSAFGVRLQNNKANYVSKMSVKAKITKKGSNEIITGRNQTGMNMAPNSNFTYYMQVGRNTVRPGKYHLTLDAKGSGKTWYISKDFEVTRSQANEVNNGNFLLPKSHLWLYILIAVVFLILFTLIVMFFYFKGQNKARLRLENSLQVAKKGPSTKNDKINRAPKRRRR